MPASVKHGLLPAHIARLLRTQALNQRGNVVVALLRLGIILLVHATADSLIKLALERGHHLAAGIPHINAQKPALRKLRTGERMIYRGDPLPNLILCLPEPVGNIRQIPGRHVVNERPELVRKLR